MSALKFFKKKNSLPEQTLTKSRGGKEAPTTKASTSGLSVSQPRLVLKSPHLSEKASLLKEKNNVYVFTVEGSANKKLIQQEVEKAYKVKVEKVRIINLPKKPRNLGRTRGYRSGFKKALVYLAAGQKIELF